MEEDGFPMFPYIEFKQRPDLKKGLVALTTLPRYETTYGGLQNRIFFLIETHMLKDYKTRVTGTYHLLKNIIRLCNREKDNLQLVNGLSDEQSANQLAGKILPIALGSDLEDSTVVDFLGIDYKIGKSDISGGDWVQYTGKPVKFKVAYFGRKIVIDSVVVPYAYLIPEEWIFAIEKLKLHGVEIKYLPKDTTLEVESYRFGNVRWQNNSYEGHHLVDFDQEVIEENRFYPQGTVVVFMNKRTNRVIVNL